MSILIKSSSNKMAVEKGVQLTEDLILSKSKADSIIAIKNLNLWSCQLQDLRLLRKMPNIQVLSLSVNKIKTLAQFAFCKNLQELYLRKNLIKNIKEISHLLKLPKLRILWLSENPCSKLQNYRLQVIKALPNLVRLDNQNVTDVQRQEALKLKQSEFNQQNQIVQRAAQKSRRGKTKSSRLQAVLLLLKQLRTQELLQVKFQLQH